MSSKNFILVAGALVIIAFAHISFTDVVRIKQNLQSQRTKIESLNKEYKELDLVLDDTKKTREKNQAEVHELEEEKNKLETERQKLEKELQA